jgi:hypothetical protein
MNSLEPEGNETAGDSGRSGLTVNRAYNQAADDGRFISCGNLLCVLAERLLD